jgi:glycosyltransferase involved in cell wall biosynthesis
MEILAWSLANQLAKQGAAVTLLTTLIPGHNGPFTQAGVDILPLDAASGKYSTKWWAATQNYLASQSASNLAAILSVSAAGFGLLKLKNRFAGVPFIMQAHGTSWDEILSKWRSGSPKSILKSGRNLYWLPKDLAAYRKFDTVVAVGETVAASLARPPISLFLPAAKRMLIANGIDTTLFGPSLAARQNLRRRLDVSDNTKVIISANRLHAQKGTANGIEAFSLLARGNPSHQYWIAGDGPEAEHLKSLAAQRGVQNQVRFLGRLDRAILATHMQAADVFLFLTERVEGLPLNVLEALASGLPAVVSSDIGLFNTKSLIPVAPRNHSEAAAALRQAALAGAVERSSLLPPEYDIKTCARAYLSLIEKLKHA